jgi:hypothetical protein
VRLSIVIEYRPEQLFEPKAKPEQSPSIDERVIPRPVAKVAIVP